jgi:hypothetical protein
MPDLVPLLHGASQSLPSVGGRGSTDVKVEFGGCPGGGPRWAFRPSFTCVTFLREPLSRAISFYHDKLPIESERLPFGRMSLAQQLQLIQYHNVSSAMVSFLSRRQSDDADALVPSLKDAMAVLDRCVVGVQDRMMESYRVINYAFPWLHLPVSQEGQSNSIRLTHPSSHIEPRDLSEKTQQILRSFLYPDVLLYEHAVKRFELQLADFRRAGRASHVPVPRHHSDHAIKTQHS